LKIPDDLNVTYLAGSPSATGITPDIGGQGFGTSVLFGGFSYSALTVDSQHTICIDTERFFKFEHNNLI
jgi:hypothetical protein